jgi:hypothetical protein
VAWQRIRRRIVAAARAANLPYAKCGHPIDYTASGRTRFGPSVDHVYALAIYGGEIALDESLLRICTPTATRAWAARSGRARHLGRVGPKRAITAFRTRPTRCRR